ncbi:hypothetical protein COOONC_19529 [Cooperia oncophora]
MPVRGRERKRRRRHSDSEDEDSIFTGWKLGLVVGVIVVCFAMLYPTLIHPMLMNLIGKNAGSRRERKRRRRHSDSEDEDSIFTGWKLGLVVGVIVVCFAMLYPTLIHPMLMNLIGKVLFKTVL